MNATSANSGDFLGHPKGLYVCFFTEMWERFSFYGMKALLFLYLTKYHLFGDGPGYDVIGAYGGLVYALPVIGGLLADRYLGMRKAVIFGGILLCLGHLGMAVEGQAAQHVDGAVVRDTSALWVFYFSLALIIAGVGFLKPNISTIVGRLYAEQDPRRDSGFSLFYAGINLGALFASLVCGFLGETYGWRYGFGAAGIGMLAGLAMFLWGQKYLDGHAEPTDPAWLATRSLLGLNREKLIYVGAILALPVVAGLMWSVANGAFKFGEISLALLLMLVMMVGVLLWFMYFVLTKCDKIERDRMIALMVLIFFTLVFFTLYEQTYGSWVAFTDRLLTKDLFPSMVIASEHKPVPWTIFALLAAPAAFVVSVRMTDRNPSSSMPRITFIVVIALMLLLMLRDLLVLPQTAGSLTYLGALFIVLLAPLFSGIWAWLDRRGMNPPKPIKSALGLVFGGLAFVPLAVAAEQVGASGQMASVWWLALAYLVLEVGEMCLAPVGLSAVTQLSVARVTALMMGTWFLATAFSETLAALFGRLAAIDVPEGETIDLALAAAKYAELFWLLTWIGLGCGLVALLMAPLLKRLMHGVR